MSSAAPLIIGTAFAVGASMVGIPPSVGFMAGSMLGSALFPAHSEGPHNSDLKAQSSQYGAMITILLGTDRLTGQVIWADDKKEHEHTESAKGGPEVTTFTVTQSFAIGLCEGPDKVVLQVFVNGQLKYDRARGIEDISFVAYPGSEEQMPDPTMEAVLGVGNVSAHRGDAYVVFTDLEEPGGVMPNLSFVVGTEVHTDHPISLVVRNNDANNPFVTGAGDDNPGPAIRSWPVPGSTSGLIRAKITYTSNVQTFDPDTLAYVGTEAVGPGDAWENAIEISTSDAWVTRKFRFVGYYVYADDTTTPLWAIPGSFRVDTHHANPAVTNNFAVPVITDSPAPFTGTGPGGPFETHGTNFLLAAGLPGTDIPIAICLSNDGKMCFVACSSGYTGYSYPYADKWYRIINGTIDSTGTCSPNLTAAFIGGAAMSAAGTSGAMFENDYRNCWISSTNAATITVFYIDDANNFAQASVHNVPTGPGLNFPLPGAYGGFGDRAFTYALPGGCKCGFIDGEALYLVERCEVTTGGTTYAAAVAEFSRRVGLVPAQYNVSQIEDPLPGYMIANQMPARSAIEALMPIDFFSMVESDCQAKAVKRGNAPVMTIDEADLGAFARGGEPGPLVLRTRTLEQDLPARCDIVFPDIDADYQNGAQGTTAGGIGNASSPITINTAVVMTNRRAKQVADANLFTALYGRDKGKINLPPKYSVLEPEDVITLQGRTERIDQVHESMSGVTTYDLIADLAALWFQNSVPAPPIFTPQDPPVPQATDLVLLDIPLLGAGGAGGPYDTPYYAAMAGAARRAWLGARLFKSNDGGLNYFEIASAATPDTIGDTSGALGDWTGGNVRDEVNFVIVVVRPGGAPLSSVTDDAMLNGANPAVICAPDGSRPELLHYRDAELIAADTYRVSGFLRGQHGTDERFAENPMGNHAAGDLFVALPVHTEIPSIFAELGALRKYRAVTAGRPLSSADEVDFTNTGRVMKPYAPVHLRGGRDAAGNIYVEFMPRTRAGDIWIDGSDAPRAEVDERYRVAMYTDNTYTDLALLPLTTPLTTPAATFTAAQQVLEFGSLRSPGNAFIEASQLGALPGYVTRAAI